WSSSAPCGRLERHPQKRRHLRGVTFFYLAEKRRGMQDGYFRCRARRVELGSIDRIEPHHGARRRKRERPERREAPHDGEPDDAELDRLAEPERGQLMRHGSRWPRIVRR